MSKSRLSAYLAGPDVFYPNWPARARYLKEACARFGIEGHFPLDEPVTYREGETSKNWAARIRESNVALVQRCDIVLANVSPFRGQNADDGTAFEVGYAEALGKPVFCYSDYARTNLRDRVWLLDDGRDPQGMEVEDFGLPVNLMLVNVHGVFDSIDTAARAAAAHYQERNAA